MADSQDYTELKTKCRSDGVLFEDDQFPATDDGFPEDILTTNGNNIVWLRPKEINENAKLIHEKPTKFDVQQGELGDCWFLGSIANLPKYKSVFEFVVPFDNNNFDDEDYCGIFHFRFWQYGHWVEVVIDDLLPTVNGALILAHSERTDVFWSALLEKAYAKRHGSYKAIEGGWTAESFEELTGGIGELFALKRETEELFDYIQLCLENYCLIGCSTSKVTKEDRISARGITDQHAYSLTGAKKISDEIRLVRIRNPWGEETEWKGAWADGSAEWSTLTPEEIEELQLTFDPDGEYWMNWQDFTNQFTEVEIGYLNPFCYCDKDEKEKYEEETVIKMASVSGAWSSEDIFKFEEESEENGENGNEENEENVSEEKEVSEGDGNDDVSQDKEEEETSEDKEGEEENEIPDDEDKKETEGENDGENDSEDQDQLLGYFNVDIELNSQELENSLQYIIKVNKPDEDADDTKYKIIVVLMLKNRRQGNFLIASTKFDVFDF